MKIKAKKVGSPVEEGKHTGKIVDVQYRETPHAYTDLYFTIDGTDKQVKYGCPTGISTESKLGQLFEILTEKEIVEEQNYDPDTLKGIKVSYMTINEKSKKGNSNMEFARVVDGSIKLRK